MKKGLVLFALTLLSLNVLAIWVGIQFHERFTLLLAVGMVFALPVFGLGKTSGLATIFCLSSCSVSFSLLSSLFRSIGSDIFVAGFFGIPSVILILIALAIFNEATRDESFLQRTLREDEAYIRQQYPRILFRIK